MLVVSRSVKTSCAGLYYVRGKKVVGGCVVIAQAEKGKSLEEEAHWSVTAQRVAWCSALRFLNAADIGLSDCRAGPGFRWARLAIRRQWVWVVVEVWDGVGSVCRLACAPPLPVPPFVCFLDGVNPVVKLVKQGESVESTANCLGVASGRDRMR